MPATQLVIIGQPDIHSRLASSALMRFLPRLPVLSRASLNLWSKPRRAHPTDQVKWVRLVVINLTALYGPCPEEPDEQPT
jgi:hypothetical protein